VIENFHEEFMAGQDAAIKIAKKILLEIESQTENTTLSTNSSTPSIESDDSSSKVHIQSLHNTSQFVEMMLAHANVNPFATLVKFSNQTSSPPLSSPGQQPLTLTDSIFLDPTSVSHIKQYLSDMFHVDSPSSLSSANPSSSSHSDSTSNDDNLNATKTKHKDIIKKPPEPRNPLVYVSPIKQQEQRELKIPTIPSASNLNDNVASTTPHPFPTQAMLKSLRKQPLPAAIAILHGPNANLSEIEHRVVHFDFNPFNMSFPTSAELSMDCKIL